MAKENQSTASNLVTLGLVGVGAFFLIKHINRQPDVRKRDLNQAIKEAEGTGLRLSYSPLFYEQAASVIYDAFRSNFASDNDDNAIRKLKRMQNDLDILELVKAYGYRQHYYLDLGILKFEDGPRRNLFQSVVEELSLSELATVNNDYKAKGMTFRF